MEWVGVIILSVLSYHKLRTFVNALFKNYCYFVNYYCQAQFEILLLLKLNTIQ